MVMIKQLCVLFFSLTCLIIDTVTLRGYISRIKTICTPFWERISLIILLYD